MKAPKKFRKPKAHWLNYPSDIKEFCPKKHKRAYSKPGAKEAIKRMRKIGVYQYIYLCSCNWYHTATEKQ